MIPAILEFTEAVGPLVTKFVREYILSTIETKAREWMSRIIQIVGDAVAGRLRDAVAGRQTTDETHLVGLVRRVLISSADLLAEQTRLWASSMAARKGGAKFAEQVLSVEYLHTDPWKRGIFIV